MNIRQIATLARLHLSKKEEELFEQQFQSILGFVEQISSVSTENIEPLVTPTETTQKLREDLVTVWPHTEEVLEKAPACSGRLFKVPPVT